MSVSILLLYFTLYLTTRRVPTGYHVPKKGGELSWVELSFTPASLMPIGSEINPGGRPAAPAKLQVTSIVEHLPEELDVMNTFVVPIINFEIFISTNKIFMKNKFFIFSYFPLWNFVLLNFFVCENFNIFDNNMYN